MEFSTFSEGMKYVSVMEKKMGKMKYRCSEEYKMLYPKLTEMYKEEGLKPITRRRIEIRFCIS